jgi:hypothetical protein
MDALEIAVRELTTAEIDQVSGGTTTTFPFPTAPWNSQPKHPPLQTSGDHL